MGDHNRQCFFLTENRYYNGVAVETSLPWKNTRNYMNKMTVSEYDQFEIFGCFAIPVATSKEEQEQLITESKNISARVINKLSAASGIVDVLVSGISLCRKRNLHKHEGPGLISTNIL